MSLSDINRIVGPCPLQEESSCASSSLVRPAGSARPSCPSCSPPGTRSSAWPVPTAAADAVAGLGAEVHRGDLDDVASLRAGAEKADGVVHLGYHHDFAQMAEAAQLDRQAIEAMADVLAGTDGPLVVAGGVLGLGSGRVATEHDQPDPAIHPRVATGAAVLAWPSAACARCWCASRPTVHGPGDHGFVATLVELARRTGMAGYVDDGANRWPAVHRLDAAALVRRAVESAPAGSVLHAVDEQGVPARDIAEAHRPLGRRAGAVDPGGRRGRALRLDRHVLRHGRAASPAR